MDDRISKLEDRMGAFECALSPSARRQVRSHLWHLKKMKQEDAATLRRADEEMDAFFEEIGSHDG